MEQIEYFLHFGIFKKSEIKAMKRFEKHIFVSENKRPDGHPKGCCANKNSIEVRVLLKERLKELGLSSNIRSNAAGCLDACEHGATVVIYPGQTWYGNVTIGDVEEIIEELNLKFQQDGLPLIKLLKTNENIAYVRIDNAAVLTQQMGTHGSISYMNAVMYSLASIDTIDCVMFDFKEGDHAIPGKYCR